MINYDDVTKENINEHNPNWFQISDHPYGILIIGGFGETRILNLIKKNKMMMMLVLLIKFIYILKI